MTAMLLMLAVLTADGPDVGGSTGVGNDTHLNCGSYCLYTCLIGLDLYQGGYEELERELGPPGALGYSIARLQEVAESHGAHTLALETDLDRLPGHRRPFACIALLDGNHFVAVADVTERGVAVVDPPRSYTLPPPTFASRWDGRALLLAPEPVELLTPFPWLVVVGSVLALLAVGIVGRWGYGLVQARRG